MMVLRMTAERGLDITVFPANLKVQIFCQSSSLADTILVRLGYVGVEYPEQLGPRCRDARFEIRLQIEDLLLQRENGPSRQFRNVGGQPAQGHGLGVRLIIQPVVGDALQ
jgi:hypothetical protein